MKSRRIRTSEKIFSEKNVKNWIKFELKCPRQLGASRKRAHLLFSEMNFLTNFSLSFALVECKWTAAASFQQFYDELYAVFNYRRGRKMINDTSHKPKSQSRASGSMEKLFIVLINFALSSKSKFMAIFMRHERDNCTARPLFERFWPAVQHIVASLWRYN